MASKPKRRSFNLRRVSIAASPTIGALVAEDVVSNAMTDAGTDPYRVTSIKASFAWADKALVDDAMEFGYAHSDYTDPEVEEALEATASIDRGNKVAQEQANRLVRRIGTIGGASVTAAGGVGFNDGRPVKTKLNWKMSTGDTINLWIRNGSANDWTTGSSLTVIGEMWIAD